MYVEWIGHYFLNYYLRVYIMVIYNYFLLSVSFLTNNCWFICLIWFTQNWRLHISFYAAYNLDLNTEAILYVFSYL